MELDTGYSKIKCYWTTDDCTMENDPILETEPPTNPTVEECLMLMDYGFYLDIL